MSILSFLGTAAAGVNAATGESERLFKEAMAESERLRAIATSKASALQKVGQSYAENGNMQAAGKLVPDFAKSFNQAYGTDLSTAPILGSPVMKQGVEKMEQLGPAMPGKLMPRVDTPAPYQYDTGERTFGPESEAAIRGGLLLPKVKPETFKLSAGETQYEQLPGQAPKAVASLDPRPASAATKYIKSVDAAGNPVWVVAAPGVAAYEKPDSESGGTPVQNKVTGEWFIPKAGMKTDVPPQMTQILNPDGSVTIQPVPRGVPTQVKPMPAPKVRTAVELQAEAEAEFASSSKNFVPPSVVKKRDKWKADAKAKDAAAYADWQKRNPSGATVNPSAPRGGGGGAPVRGVMNIAPPAKYEDTALLPDWESRAQAALKVAPGIEISSRARSKDRNANAKPGGGAPNSWHTHRQAFDVVKYDGAQKAKLREWARSEGLHMIDEGNHLHFEPARVSDAGQAPALVAFYEKHGITPGAANA